MPTERAMELYVVTDSAAALARRPEMKHVPPPLLQQLKAGGVMVVPVGPPGAQRVLKVAKTQGADGSITASREDIYGGKIVPFVPFTSRSPGGSSDP